ncbi:hypothetical protein SAMN05216262_109113 [Colwellia chukchiensis]|uniref:Uncharacterized protein n=1 Tax=Colwellia chukchiensis TaxID=641665 RepID=A0A1H7PHU4_9GAMM|nr:hypothetical protein [Colwellia chukchiensis]SEL34855.1 hypothetical protein SAMN05216262_109113 [Colwellia chukchiensis]
MKYLKSLLITTTLMASFTSSAAAIAPELLRCSKLTDNTLRLQCFDKYMQRVSSIAANNTAKNKQPPKTSVKAEAKNEEKLIASFGHAHRYSEQEREFDQLTAVVKSAARNLKKQWNIVLDNGQVWREKGGDKRAKFAPGDTIIITRGIMNSFQLKKQGTKRRIRVQRIQ